MTVASVELGGIRTLVQVPLFSERGPIGLFILYRREVRPFTDRQVAWSRRSPRRPRSPWRTRDC